MDYNEIQPKLCKRGFTNKRNDKVIIRSGEDIYRVTTQKVKERHKNYCQNIINVPVGTYLTDIIGDDYKNWKLGDDIWLNSACGTGKTTFVMNTIEYYLEQGYKILYLTNRTQLLNQVKINVMKKLDHKDKNTPVGCLHLIKDIDKNIYFSTYQGLAETYKKGNLYRPGVFTKHRVLLVCDEVHWFTSDCLFSENPDYVLDKLLQQFSSSITLYMTSTDWDILDEIGSRLVNIHQDRYIGQRDLGVQFPSSVFTCCYTTERFDKTKIKAFSFNSYDNILEQINSTHTNEKWLIFADTKEHGKELEGKISDSVFIFSEDWSYKLDREGKDEIATVVTDEMFKHRILIATSILDCGTTINDKDVKHVVVNSIDPVTTMQFVGRVRRNGSSLNLYFNARSNADIWKRFSDIDDKINLVEKVTANSKALSNNINGLTSLLSSRWVYYNDNGDLVCNNLGIKMACSLRIYIWLMSLRIVMIMVRTPS